MRAGQDRRVCGEDFFLAGITSGPALHDEHGTRHWPKGQCSSQTNITKRRTENKASTLISAQLPHADHLALHHGKYLLVARRRHQGQSCKPAEGWKNAVAGAEIKAGEPKALLAQAMYHDAG